jgi:hypothetical protein
MVAPDSADAKPLRSEVELKMLTQPNVQRYSTNSGLRDIMIAEKEVVLTFLLQREQTVAEMLRSGI